jgi:Domain of Unknown Function (DUF1080)
MAATTLAAGAVAAQPGAPGGGFVALYNGRDFTGWHVNRGKWDPWRARPDMISFSGKGGGSLQTDREYGDFELRLEYRISRGGNSGIGIRVPPGGWPSTDGFEIQILDDNDPRYAQLKPEDRHGSIYKHVAPKAHPFKPAGEWNRIDVRCEGPHVVIRVNDVEIHNVNLDDYRDSYGKGKIPLGRRPRKGQIGFPSHDDPVDFRNIEIREL